MILDYLWEKFIGVRPGYTCFRYLCLSVPAYMYLKGIGIKKVIPLVLISIIYLALMLYSNVPVYTDSFLPDGWEAQTSLGFFYTLFLFVLLSKLFNIVKDSSFERFISYIGTISWEVFLVQMVLIGSGVISFMGARLFATNYMQAGFALISTLVLSLVFAELYNKILNFIRNRII